MSSFHYIKLTPWTKVSLDNHLLGQSYLGQKSLGQLSPWTIVPWTIGATPLKKFASKKTFGPTIFRVNKICVHKMKSKKA